MDLWAIKAEPSRQSVGGGARVTASGESIVAGLHAGSASGPDGLVLALPGSGGNRRSQNRTAARFHGSWGASLRLAC